MRKILIICVILIILFHSGLGESATRKEDFKFEDVYVIKNEIGANIKNNVAPVYDISVKVVNLPECMILMDVPVKSISVIFPQTPQRVKWRILLNDSCNITKDNFEVLLWDNSVLLYGLSVNGYPIDEFLVVNTSKIRIEGFTDSIAFCEKMRRETSDPKWLNQEHCNTKVRINNQSWFYADDEGYFISDKLELREGNNTFTITVKDPGWNTNTTTFVVEYRPTLADWIQMRIMENWYYILSGIMVFVVASLSILYVVKKQRELIMKRKEFENMKQRRNELRKKLDELNKKAPLVGLTQEEAVMKKNYEQELVALQEELLERPEFQRELNHTVEKVVKWVKSGVPSKEIKQKLVEMGYTQKEILIIQNKFREKLGKNSGKENINS